jgi:undecaprenyl-diphosphatase
VGALKALVLGLVQGMTEFLPVSSDGHLAIAYRVFGMEENLTFVVFLHLATLLAMVTYFRSDIVVLLKSLLPAGKGSHERRLVWLIVLATGVSGIIAFAMEKAVVSATESLIAIGAGFLVTAAALAGAEMLAKRVQQRDTADLGWWRTVAVAVAQASATLPGVSRSGTTIAGGMLAGLSREAATRFAFLLGMPIIAVANVYKLKDVVSGQASMPGVAESLIGFIAAGAAGYAAIAMLLAVVRRRPLYVFSVYTAVVGLAVIVWGLTAR